MRQELLDSILQMPRFQSVLSAASRKAIVGDLPLIQITGDGVACDWSYALLCCSLLTQSEDEAAQDAVLRIVQSCLQDDEANEEQRAGAALLLERVGNSPALNLAMSRSMVAADSWMDPESPLTLDAIRSRMEFGVPMLHSPTVQVNGFQRRFWSAASESDWLSVSAATSAGKSFIVRQWIEEKMSQRDSFTCVYLVPTRALIEEVSADLRRQFEATVGVHTLPWDSEIGSFSKAVFVLTQERLHLLQQRETSFVSDLTFVDEAQKFGDDSRGVLLQRVIDESVRRSPNSQVVFASPLSDNPETLLEGAPRDLRRSALTSSTITVTQNLFWLNQVHRRPTKWTLQRIVSGLPELIGEVELLARPSPPSKRLPLLAAQLGANTSGNVIYVNGAADAEKVSAQLYEALGEGASIADDPRIQAVRELSQKTVHEEYGLNSVVNRGIAFHYGNMPLLLRTAIENLFREGVIKYLVCTSTLLEGVNLPCKNLFVRGPRRGRGHPMTAADFWNLAGRAGRWGKEFQGNVFCIDTSSVEQWPDPPRSRIRYPLRRATADIITDSERLLSYIRAGTPVVSDSGTRLLEALYSYLAGRIASGESLEEVPGLSGFDASILAVMESAVRESLEGIEIDSALIRRHTGISPISMQRLLTEFKASSDPTSLTISPPESADAAESLAMSFARIKRTMGGDFGASSRQFMLALLVVHWMRGHTLARIISDRIGYLQSHSRTFRTAVVIRECMTDVEQIARFEAPKYLSCYLDILRKHLTSIDRSDLLVGMPDVTMLLELGVSRTTELSLVVLGLSRTSAIALSEYIIPDELTPVQCLVWLQGRDLRTLNLPELVRLEIEELVERRAVNSG